MMAHRVNSICWQYYMWMFIIKTLPLSLELANHHPVRFSSSPHLYHHLPQPPPSPLPPTHLLWLSSDNSERIPFAFWLDWFGYHWCVQNISITSSIAYYDCSQSISECRNATPPTLPPSPVEGEREGEVGAAGGGMGLGVAAGRRPRPRPGRQPPLLNRSSQGTEDSARRPFQVLFCCVTDDCEVLSPLTEHLEKCGCSYWY